MAHARRVSSPGRTAARRGRAGEGLTEPGDLRAWMDARSLGHGPLEDVVLLTGGTQNVLLRFRRDGTEYVLRRPADGAFDDQIIVRETRVLAALSGTDVPHPRLLACELDRSVLGFPFLLMEPIDGVVATEGWPPGFADDAEAMARVGVSSVEALARLSRVEPGRVGLEDLARPGDFLERQVPRWRWQLTSYEQVEGYVPLPALPVRTVERWLESGRPPSGAVALLHGDAHLGNVMFRQADGCALALVDWELATIGDPLLDLAEFLVCWPGPGGGGLCTEILPLAPTVGLATKEELLRVDGEVSGRDVSGIEWYEVLAAYRLAVLLEGSSARAQAGRGDEATGAVLHRVAVSLMEWAADRTSCGIR